MNISCQEAIKQKANAVMALCDTLEKEIETHQRKQEDWMRSCLKEVFEGEVKEAGEEIRMAAEPAKDNHKMKS